MQPSSLADLTRAAQRQQPGAINALAQALVRAGQPEQALSWYSRSAAAGDALAQVEAGRMRAYASVARRTSVRRGRTGSWPSGRALRQQAICWRPWRWESSRWPWPALRRIDCSRQPLPTTRQRYAPSPSITGVWRIRSGNGSAWPCWNAQRQAAMRCRPPCWPSACCVAKACRPSPTPLHSSCSSCSPWA